MKLSSWMKGAMLVTVSALLIFLIMVLGCLTFTWHISNGGTEWNAPIQTISDALTLDDTGYSFTGEAFLEGDSWAILLNEEGKMVWSYHKPEDVPEEYAITEVAAFARWYLNDYPVRCWVRDDGLLVVGSPKGSVWKQDFSMDLQDILQLPVWFLGFFLLALGGVLGLAWLVLRRWFRQEQQIRDAARSNWINGVSHDIRTPLSVVMGYASQLESAPGLTPEQQRQASAIRAQSQVIRDLVNDLNLTMRLDCEMQPLRMEVLRPAAFLRQIAADFLNGGMAQGYDFEIELPKAPLPAIQADPFLLRRAVNNLLANCVRHNDSGCAIRLGARVEGKQLILWVEGGAAKSKPQEKASCPLEPDGGAAHGTGLRLVAQIAAAHGGNATFYSGTPYRCELRLPVIVRQDGL